MAVMFMGQPWFMEPDFITIPGTMVFIIIITILMVFQCVTIHGMAGVLDLDLVLLTIGTGTPIGVEDITTGDLRITDLHIMAAEITGLNLLTQFTKEEVV